MSSDPLRGVLLASDAVGALTIAATSRTGPVTTYDLLAAIVAVDRHGDWDAVQLRSTWLANGEAGRFLDRDSSAGGCWQGVPLTKQATAALRTAAEIAERYKLLPVPPAVIALGVVWDPSAGASRALLDEADISHGELLDLIQESVLGTRLMSLESVDYLGDRVEDAPLASLNALSSLLRSASRYAREADGRSYVVVTTAALMLALIADDEAEWIHAANRAGISLNAYLENLRWTSDHPSETVADEQVIVDEHLAGIRLTAELATSATIAERISRDLASGEVPDVRGLLPAVMLSLTENDAATGLTASSRHSLRTAILQASYGALVPDIDDRVHALRNELHDEQTRLPATASADRATSLGFSVGTFLGAFVVSVVGGLPLFLALGVAWLVRTAAARARRRRHRNRLLPPIAAATLVGAIVLASGAGFDFKDDRRAVLKLKSAEAAIERSDLVPAMRQLAGAALLQQESVRVTVLQACVSWEMGFKDEAALTAQVALNLGFRPGEQSHYRGRDCFLDTLDFRGLGVMKSSSVPQWMLYPRPVADDTVGQRYLEIAQAQSRTATPTLAVIALGCLADLYDLRSLASWYFTVGLNTHRSMGRRPPLLLEIRRCLASESTKGGYKFVRPQGGQDELFFPADASVRIPSPTHTRPPKEACWANFPRGGPCNAHD